MAWAYVCALSGALFAYTIARALRMSFFCDEAGVYLEQATHSFWWIVSYRFPEGSNHLLNSLLAKIALAVFGDSEFALRLPNVLAHAVYLFFSLRWCRRMRSALMVIVLFTVLNVNPYLVSFFSLARGYGLASASVLASLYFFAIYLEEGKRRCLWLAYLAGGLAVLCHFTALNYYLAFVATHVVVELERAILSARREGQKLDLRNLTADMAKETRLPVLSTVVLLCLIAVPVHRVVTLATVGFEGGNTGFLWDTVRSLAVYSLHEVNYGPFTRYAVRGALLLAVSTVLAGGAMSIAAVLKGDRKLLHEPFVVASVILLVVAISTILQFHLFGTLYLSRRTALFLLVVYGVHFAFGCRMAFAADPVRRFAVPIVVLMMVVLPVHGILGANLVYSPEYQFDACTKTMLGDLGQEIASRGMVPEQVRLRYHGLFAPSIRYYRATGRFPFLRDIGEARRSEGDYYYLLPELDSDLISERDLDTVREYPVSGSVLAVTRAGRTGAQGGSPRSGDAEQTTGATE